MQFLDTNIILRHLLNDDKAKAQACLQLFLEVEDGKLQVWTTDLVVAEVVFVLSNKKTYNFERSKIATDLLPLLQLPGIHIANKVHYPRIFHLYTTYPIDFIDCYHAAFIEKLTDSELYSYDRDFDKIPKITRLEPEIPVEPITTTQPSNDDD